LPYARRALEVLGEGVEVARQAQAGERGQVRLAALGSLGDGLVAPALTAFMRRHPQVDCLVRSGDHERVVALLLDGVVELGLLAWPSRSVGAGDFQALLELREPVLLVVGRGHPLADRRRVTRDELARLARPLFRLRWWTSHHPDLLALAQGAGAAAELPMEVARRLALTSVGAGFFTRTLVAEDLARGALVALEVSDLAPVHRDAALVRRRGGVPLSPATAGLVEALRVQASSLGLLLTGRRRPA
jgi:DNA-binding transcriptional LysR family regulator